PLNSHAHIGISPGLLAATDLSPEKPIAGCFGKQRFDLMQGSRNIIAKQTPSRVNATKAHDFSICFCKHETFQPGQITALARVAAGQGEVRCRRKSFFWSTWKISSRHMGYLVMKNCRFGLCACVLTAAALLTLSTNAHAQMMYSGGMPYGGGGMYQGGGMPYG